MLEVRTLERINIRLLLIFWRRHFVPSTLGFCLWSPDIYHKKWTRTLISGNYWPQPSPHHLWHDSTAFCVGETESCLMFVSCSACKHCNLWWFFVLTWNPPDNHVLGFRWPAVRAKNTGYKSSTRLPPPVAPHLTSHFVELCRFNRNCGWIGPSHSRHPNLKSKS